LILVTAFAKLTGDIAVLSQADIRVLALTYALEVEKNGTRRLREAPGKLSQEERERETKKQERLKQAETQPQAKKAAEDSPDLSKLSISPKASVTSSSVASTSHTSHDEAQSTRDADEISTVSTHDNETESSAPTIITQEQASSTIAADPDSDDGEWITPSNVKLHQSRDLGLFPSLPASAHAGGKNKAGEKEKHKTVLKVACLTGDFAMQNVALQIGLNVFGVGGKKIRDIKTWVLRCHACFK
jgi:RNA-binding protein NOB1